MCFIFLDFMVHKLLCVHLQIYNLTIWFCGLLVEGTVAFCSSKYCLTNNNFGYLSLYIKRMLVCISLFASVWSSWYRQLLVLTLSSLYPFIAYSTYLLQELAGLIKLSTYSSFSLFECRKVVTGSKSPDPGNGTSFSSLSLLYGNLAKFNSLMDSFIVTQRSTLG